MLVERPSVCVLASAVDDNHEDCYFVSLGFKVRLRQHKPKTAGGQAADLRSFSFCSSCEPLLHMKQTVPPALLLERFTE